MLDTGCKVLDSVLSVAVVMACWIALVVLATWWSEHKHRKE